MEGCIDSNQIVRSSTQQQRRDLIQPLKIWIQTYLLAKFRIMILDRRRLLYEFSSQRTIANRRTRAQTIQYTRFMSTAMAGITRCHSLRSDMRPVGRMVSLTIRGPVIKKAQFHVYS